MPRESKNNLSNNLEISEEVKKIIHAKPSWIVRNGILLISFIFLFIFFLSTLVNYPKIVKTSLRVKTINCPQAIVPNNLCFFGEVELHLNEVRKLRLGQRVSVKLKSMRSEGYSCIRGKINYISLRDSVLIANIEFDKIEQRNSARKIIFKTGIIVDAEIVIRDGSLFQFFIRNITKMLNNNLNRK